MDSSSKKSLSEIPPDDNLPDDNEIREILKEIYPSANETDNDSDTSDESDESDFEDSTEKFLWDGLFPNGKPYTNTLEDLQKILECLPLKFCTRQRTINPDLNQKEKTFQQMKRILKTRLVVPDIDEDILIENLQRLRNIIKKKIKKRIKKNSVTMELPECIVKLERMEL